MVEVITDARLEQRLTATPLLLGIIEIPEFIICEVAKRKELPNSTPLSAREKILIWPSGDLRHAPKHA